MGGKYAVNVTCREIVFSRNIDSVRINSDAVAEAVVWQMPLFAGALFL